LADVSAVLEVIVVMAAAAGGASWLRTLSSVENAAVEKDQFIGSVSHEFRTPLTGIVGMSEILADHPDLDPETRELAEIISHESVGMSYIIEGLLVAARAKMSELSIVLADLDVCEATRTTIGEIDVPPECSVECVSAGVTMIRSDPMRVCARY